MTHYTIVMKVIITRNLPYMLVYLWLNQLVLTYGAINLHKYMFLLGKNGLFDVGTTLAAVRLYAKSVVNFAVLKYFHIKILFVVIIAASDFLI